MEPCNTDYYFSAIKLHTNYLTYQHKSWAEMNCTILTAVDLACASESRLAAVTSK